MKDDPFAAMEEAGLTEEQVKTLKMAKQLQDDPLSALNDNLTEEQKKQLELAKKLKDDPLSALEDADMTPEQRQAL